VQPDKWTFNLVKKSYRRHHLIVNAAAFLFLLILIIFSWNKGGGEYTDSDKNTLAISITALEVFLIVAAVAGFWMIRNVAVDKAQEAARDEINRLNRDGQLKVNPGESKPYGETGDMAGLSVEGRVEETEDGEQQG